MADLYVLMLFFSPAMKQTKVSFDFQFNLFIRTTVARRSLKGGKCELSRHLSSLQRREWRYYKKIWGIALRNCSF